MSPRFIPCVFAFVAGLLAIVSGDIPDAAAQQPKAPAVTPSPQAPTLNTPANLGAKAGETLELTLTGTNLAEPVAVLLGCTGTVSIPTDNKNGTDATKVRVKVELPADCPIGLHTIRVATKQGVSNFRPFVVDELPVVAEIDTNRAKDTPQPVNIPAVVTGRTDVEASDYFKVKVNAGQTLTFEVLARRIGSPLDPIVVLHDAKTKRELINLYADDTPGLQSDCRLTHTFEEAGEFLVEVRDTTYRGGPDYYYRLRIGDFPGATTAFPRRGPARSNRPCRLRRTWHRGHSARQCEGPADARPRGHVYRAETPGRGERLACSRTLQRYAGDGRTGAEQRRGQGEQVACSWRRFSEIRKVGRPGSLRGRR